MTKISEKIGVNSWNIDETTILRFPTNLSELGIENACKRLQKVGIYIFQVKERV